MDSTHSENPASSSKNEKRKRGQQPEPDHSNDETAIQEATGQDGASAQDDKSTIPRAASSGRARNGLTRDQAVEIYARRPDEMGFHKSRRGTMVGCEAVAVEFGVTPKTIRDIWRGRTWGEATGHPQSDGETRSVPRHPPRPRPRQPSATYAPLGPRLPINRARPGHSRPLSRSVHTAYA